LCLVWVLLTLALSARARAQVAQWLGLRPSRDLIHVFLFHNKSTYQGYVK
jgi:hypothetical protein